MATSTRIPLVDAALKVGGMTYHQIRNKVLSGALKGGKDEFGRLYVDADDLKRLQRKRLARSRSGQSQEPAA